MRIAALIMICLLGSCATVPRTPTPSNGTAEMLHEAIGAQEYNRVRRILAADPSLANHLYEGLTALHRAIFEPDLKMAKIVLDSGANPNVRDEDGYHAIEWHPFDAEYLALLLKYGIDDEGLDSALLFNECWIPENEQDAAIRTSCIDLLRRAGAGTHARPKTRQRLTRALVNGEGRYVYVSTRARTIFSEPFYIYLLRPDMSFVRRGALHGEYLSGLYWWVEVLEREKDPSNPRNWHMGALTHVGYNVDLVAPDDLPDSGWIRMIEWSDAPLPPKKAFIPDVPDNEDKVGVLRTYKLKGIKVRIISVP